MFLFVPTFYFLYYCFFCCCFFFLFYSGRPPHHNHGTDTTLTSIASISTRQNVSTTTTTITGYHDNERSPTPNSKTIGLISSLGMLFDNYDIPPSHLACKCEVGLHSRQPLRRNHDRYYQHDGQEWMAKGTCRMIRNAQETLTTRSFGP